MVRQALHTNRLTVFLVLMAGTCIHAGNARAQSTFDLGRLALVATDFPQTAEIVESRAEPNSLVASDQVLPSRSKSLVQNGRLTGYFLKAVQPNIDAAGDSHPVLTQYIASIFSSDTRANAAFDQQRKAWEALVLHPPTDSSVTRNQTADIRAGEGGRLFSYSAGVSTDLGAAQATVVVFATGSALIEVSQFYLSADARPYGEAAHALEIATAQKLDTRIRTIPSIAPVAFQIVSVKAEPFGSATQLNGTGLQRVRRGLYAYISVYVSANRLPPSSTISARIIVVRASRVRGDFKVTQLVGATATQVHRLFVPFRFGVAGAVSIRTVVRIAGTTRSANAMLTVVP